MEKFVNRIYNDLCRFNPLFRYIEKEDVNQEIRFALLTAKQEYIYRVASKLCYNLATDYGFSRKKGKDNFEPFYKQPEFTQEELELINNIEEYYLEQDHTARETAAKYGFEHNNKTAKLLASCFPKFKSNRIKSKLK